MCGFNSYGMWGAMGHPEGVTSGGVRFQFLWNVGRHGTSTSRYRPTDSGFNSYGMWGAMGLLNMIAGIVRGFNSYGMWGAMGPRSVNPLAIPGFQFLWNVGRHGTSPTTRRAHRRPFQFLWNVGRHGTKAVKLT